jgi:hypothetical protein
VTQHPLGDEAAPLDVIGRPDVGDLLASSSPPHSSSGRARTPGPGSGTTGACVRHATPS